MASGVSVADECIEAFDEVKLGHKHRYVIYTLNQNQDTIVVECKLTKKEESTGATPEEKYGKFMQVLNSKKEIGECCYAVYDAEYTRKNGQRRSKIIFIVWCPDTAVIKRKMLYASSKDYIRKKFMGISAEIQGTEIDEVTWDVIIDKLERLETST